MALVAVAETETLYPLDEAAKKLGVSYMTIWRRVRRGKTPCIRIGRSYLVKLEDVQLATRQQKEV
jgi:excisionase family DNA binding protein